MLASRTKPREPPLRGGERGFADGERRPDRAVLAQRDRDRARVGSDQSGNALLVEPRGQGLLGEMVRGMVRDLLDDRSGCAGAPVLRGASGDAVVADHRIRERENLPGVRRIGERLFVARHAGVKDRLAERRSLESESMAFEAAAVGEEERCRGRRDRSRCEILRAVADVSADDRREHYPRQRRAGERRALAQRREVARIDDPRTIGEDRDVGRRADR